jgi:succinate dehydrogenase/fumarate reductase iron-sulfur protein
MRSHFTVHKFNPQKNTRPSPVEYVLDIDPRETVLMALTRIQENLDPDLAFRYACNARKCGECGLLVNNKAVLACDEQVQPDQTIEALPFFPVIKDLVVDTEPFLKKTSQTITRGMSLFASSDRITPIDLEVLKGCLEPTQCMGCLLCQAACPLARKAQKHFSGPFPLLALSQLALDPRFEGAFTIIAREMGAQVCSECGKCTGVCPQQVDVPALFLKLFGERRDL